MKTIRCEICGKPLYSVNDDGLVRLTCGYISKIDGACECGHGFHYSVTDRLLERIIERYNQRVEVQEAFGEFVRKQGYKTAVAYTVEKAIEILKEYINGADQARGRD